MPKQMSNARPVNSIELRNRGGKSVQLTSTQLAQWLVKVESLNPASETLVEDPEGRATKLISRFGFQTPQDLIVFLNSPAGEAVLGMIGEELAEIAAITEYQRQQLFDDRLIAQHRLAYLLLALADRREASAAHLNEKIQQDIDKQKELNKPHAPAPEKEDAKIDVETYGFAITAIEHALESKINDSIHLELQLAELEQQHQMTEKKYASFEAHLEEMDQFTHLPIQDIEIKIIELKKALKAQALAVNKLLNKGKYDAARELLVKSNAHNLQLAFLQDRVSVHTGLRVLYTLAGRLTTSFGEAAFILPKEKKIVKDGEHYYYLPADKNPLNLSHADKKAAEKAYQRVKPEIMGVRQLVQHNLQLEQTSHNEKKTALSLRSEVMQKDILLLTNHLALMQAAQANAIQLGKQPQPSPSPKMTPPSAPVAPRPSAPQKCYTTSYRHLVQLMSSNPSARSIQWLNACLAEESDPVLKKQLCTLKPGQPIPPQTMSLLLKKDLGGMWVDTSKLEAAAAVPIPTPQTAPTPFNMRLKPRG